MSETESRSALIIGYGSPIRGDDAVGPIVADRLQAEGVPEAVTVVARHVLTADLVPDIAASDLVVFLDAATDGEAGSVRCRRLEPDLSNVSTMAHFLDPRELLAWSQVLYGHRPEAYLITLTGESFDYASYRLTGVAEIAIGAMSDKVRELLARP
jgi:hydrogenase maturation protease